MSNSPLSSPTGDANPADSNDGVTYFIIQGDTEAGKKFRPSDWCDRLHGTLRALGDEADYYANYVHLVNIQDKRCLMINNALKEINGILYSFFVRFAKENNLSTHTLTDQEWKDLRD